MGLKFSLKTSAISVTLEGASGQSEDYELCEMTAAMRDQYLDTIPERLKLDLNGNPSGIRKFDGLQADLVARSLRKRDGKTVARDIIQAWPASTVASLFAEAQKLNHLGQEEKEAEAKNG